MQPPCTALWKSSSLHQGPGGLPTSQQLLLVYCSTSAEMHAPSSCCPGSAASQPTDSGSTKPMTDQPAPDCSSTSSQRLGFVRVWGAGLSCHWRPQEPLWFCSCPSGVCRQTALIVGFSHCQDIHHPCRTQQTGKKEGWGGSLLCLRL